MSGKNPTPYAFVPDQDFAERHPGSAHPETVFWSDLGIMLKKTIPGISDLWFFNLPRSLHSPDLEQKTSFPDGHQAGGSLSFFIFYS